MRDHRMHFHGNVPYCYSNSVAMLLSAEGEHVYPGHVEVLTGVGLGAVRVPEGQTFLSLIPPNAGIDTALELLGCSFSGRSGLDGSSVEETLRKELATGPIMIGPVDMGRLTYVPWHRQATGSDHYLVAYDIDDDGVFLHDPAGFPCARLGFDDLSRAWQGDTIGYPAPAYQRWAEIRRVRTPTERATYDAAMDHYARIYRAGPGSGDVVRRLADDVRPGRVDQATSGFLSSFTFPLGARRAVDYGAFFADGGDLALAAAKDAQARLLGSCVGMATRDDWAGVAAALDDLARHEDDLERAFTD